LPSTFLLPLDLTYPRPGKETVHEMGVLLDLQLHKCHSGDMSAESEATEPDTAAPCFARLDSREVLTSTPKTIFLLDNKQLRDLDLSDCCDNDLHL
jgi:hypothetical protein